MSYTVDAMTIAACVAQLACVVALRRRARRSIAPDVGAYGMPSKDKKNAQRASLRQLIRPALELLAMLPWDAMLWLGPANDANTDWSHLVNCVRLVKLLQASGPAARLPLVPELRLIDHCAHCGTLTGRSHLRGSATSAPLRATHGAENQ